ncbi:MAG: YdeI/OmpD-associated family protein [Chloroflexi bacterium]|nr:YdeI/OmpD-associated family protein [Chloroflexota bacterium]
MGDGPIRLTRPVHPMPEFVKDSIVRRGLLEAYRSRPPYQRNDYIGWISRAKQQKTQEKRLAQMLDELAAGDSYMGMKYKGARSRRVIDYLSPEAVRSLAALSNLRLGKEIAVSGGVELIESSPALVVARVRPEGGQRRTVELRSTEKGLTWKCTCTTKGTFCKHCVAAAVVVQRRPDFNYSASASIKASVAR